MSLSTDQALSLELQGLVQGIGFRPAVVLRARRLGLRGWVANSPKGVVLEAQGPRALLQQFLDQLLEHPPDLSKITAVQKRWQPIVELADEFQIVPSSRGGSVSALLSPDLAICLACQAELMDPASRRFRYPFISCTHCGPRYSVARALPFEREHTSFSAFPLCDACSREYANPVDRRFHAQTISCPNCGPQLFWNGARLGLDDALEAAVALLREGQVVALQGIGGFQLLADPRSREAIASLRLRKGRPEKPFALLSQPQWLDDLCHGVESELGLWHSHAAPIVLMRRRENAAVVDGVMGASPWLGLMRPAGALQHLLLDHFGAPLVATSANRSGEPIAANAEKEHGLLAQLADAVLSHELAILNRIDDSVIRLAANGPLVLRFGRGLAPRAITRSTAARQTLALGAESKGALALSQADQLILSPDLGETSSCTGADHLEATTRQWLQLHRLTPIQLRCDQHLGYRSSQWAQHWSHQDGLPLQTVQHHQAHLLAVMAEHGITEPALGVVWDGSGLGADGTLWGGEALLVSGHGYRRLGHLRPFGLVGLERAQREPRRAALGLLVEAYGVDWRERLSRLPHLPWLSAFESDEGALLEALLQGGTQSGAVVVRCSSVGRLFDAVAALLGGPQCCSYEAQAALALEALAMSAQEQQVDQVKTASARRYGLRLHHQQAETPWHWDWRPLLEAILSDLEAGLQRPWIALYFHQALADAIAEFARLEGARQLLLAGGCFQNRVLLELTLEALQARGICGVWSQALPCNDAAIPLGQLIALP